MIEMKLNKDEYDGLLVCPTGEAILTNEEYLLERLKPRKRNSIKIKYFTDIDKIKELAVGDWIDLRSAEDIELKAGEFKLIPLGVAMELPEDYEAHLVPRSSTFKTWGIIQTNSMGVIDNSYCGDNDEWKMPVYATRNTVIHKNDRICQFRVVEKMIPMVFDEVESLDNEDRGGFGSTGQN